MSHTPLTILCDLDDTLLKNDFSVFLPAYLAAFSRAVPQLPHEVFVSNLMFGTDKMIANQSPTHTLQEVFDAAFFSAIEMDRQALEPVINHFYGEIFRTLKPLTAPKAESKALVAYALEHHANLVIATNPLFPFTATAQRLEWAGIPADEHAYALVTTYETFHFSKPHPAYYAEILGRLGWPESRAVMVGNDLEEDIRPASVLGLPTYWITDRLESPEFIRHPLSAQGKLEGVILWLEELAAQLNIPSSLPADSLPSVIRANTAVFDTFLRPRHAHEDLNPAAVLRPLIAALLQHEAEHHAALRTLRGREGANVRNENTPPPCSGEPWDGQAYFSGRKKLLAAIADLLERNAAQDEITALHAFLRTVVESDQRLIREFQRALAV